MFFLLSHVSLLLFSASTTSYSDRCSAIGPSARAGKKVSAAKMYTINTRTIINTTLSVLSVPMDSLTLFLARREPAIAAALQWQYTFQRTLQFLLSHSRIHCCQPVPQNRNHCLLPRKCIHTIPGSVRGRMGL